MGPHGVQWPLTTTRLAGDFVNRFSQTLNIAAGDASDRDPTILGSVDRVLEQISIIRWSLY